MHSRRAASALLSVAELFEKIQGGAIGRQCSLDRFVMSLNRMTHCGVRDSQSAERLVVSIEQGLKLPIEIRIHWSQGVRSSLSSVTQMGRRRLR